MHYSIAASGVGALASVVALAGVVGTAGAAEPVYLNDQNISVSLGASMSAEPFANRTTAESLANLIDAPSADAGELHTQPAHVWVSGGPLEVDFDFGMAYDLSTFHFWNYHSEAYDVDNIDLVFYDASMTEVGSLLGIEPALGNGTGSDSDPIFAEDFVAEFDGVRYVNAVLTGANGQVDFNNMGFTAVPEPGTVALLAPLGLALLRRRGRG
ncbi:MAG: hypothetical protein WD009_00520 [Phycisphaeraceae bacterium]